MDNKTLDEPVVEGALYDPPLGSAGHHYMGSRSRRSSSGNHKVSRRLTLTIALAVSLLVLLAVIIFSVVSIGGLDSEINALQTDLAKARQELSRIGPELEQTRKIVSEMTKGRLPHLLELVPDKVLNINSAYLKNIVFTVLNQNGTKSYEYKLVMENSTGRTIHPAAKILVFDRYGIQIGGAEMAGRTEIAPGESRSQSSVIELFLDEEPRYFYISTSPADKLTGLIQ